MEDDDTFLEETPTYDRLRAHRLAHLIGIEQAQHGLAEPLLQQYWADYERRRTDHTLALALIDAQIAALPKVPLYSERRTADFKALALAYKNKQVTPREFSQRATWLRGVRAHA